jgi:hypothetical protein
MHVLLLVLLRTTPVRPPLASRSPPLALVFSRRSRGTLEIVSSAPHTMSLNEVQGPPHSQQPRITAQHSIATMLAWTIGRRVGSD